MKKIFLVVSHAVVDCDDCGTKIRAFETKEKAQRFFNNLVKFERRVIEDTEWEVTVDTDYLFESNKEGDFTRNHSWVEIRELEVE